MHTLKIDLPFGHKTQSAVAVVAYKYLLDRKVKLKVIRDKEAQCVGPSILYVEVSQDGRKVVLPKSEFENIFWNTKAMVVEICQRDNKVRITSDNLHLIAKSVEEIPAIRIDENAILTPIKLPEYE